jgi:tetratricopeptide (TPR) repeat protein
MTVPTSSLVAIALSVGVVCWVLLRTPGEVAPGPTPAASAAETAVAASTRHDDLERRVQRLEEASAVTSSPRHEAAPVPVPAEAARDDASTITLERRLAAVERLLQQVRSEQLAIGPMPSDLGAIVKALADKNLYGDVAPELRQRRMDLRQRLLELAPGDPQAGKVLLDLANDSLMAHGPRTAIEVLDRFAGRTNVQAGQLARAYANFHGQAGDGDRARSYYDSILRDAATSEADRASTRFWHAYSFYQQQRYDEAAQGFAALISSYGDDPPATVRNSVDGARDYLQKCRERK